MLQVYNNDMGKAIKIGIPLVALIFLALGGYLWYTNWKTGIMKIPPKAPSELIARPLSATQVRLNWKDNSNNEIGFLLYRDGKRVTELSENTKTYMIPN